MRLSSSHYGSPKLHSCLSKLRVRHHDNGAVRLELTYLFVSALPENIFLEHNGIINHIKELQFRLILYAPAPYLHSKQ